MSEKQIRQPSSDRGTISSPPSPVMQYQKLMDETNSLRNELITARNKNKDLQKIVEQLKAALATARNNAASVPGYYPVHASTTIQNELDQEKAKNKALEQRTAELEAKWSSKQDEFLSIIGVMNRKLESCERAKVSLEKEVNKISYQKRGLEKKILSLQGPETALVCHSVDWNMDANLWTQTNEFLENSNPTLTLWAAETVESLTNQLKDEKKHLSRAKDLLVQHQDQLTKLITALNKPYSCRTIISSDTIEANEVGETIETLFQKIQSLQEGLVSKDYEINQLKTRKAALEIDNEKLGILKSQVIVYRSDYLAERKTRETITNDRDRLIAEIQLLKEENKQLSMHLTAHGITAPSLTGTRLAMRSERKIQTPPPHVPITTVSMPDVNPGISEPLVCPNPDCKRKFDSLEPLQYHVHQCLQLSD
uniref:NF-kappa-B essential modulator NEMO CC2-LZ domain-containing protein n=1 Tax=Lygus hesperus TaxID=30085 RepID=A0A0K8T6H7_LYGHE